MATMKRSRPTHDDGELPDMKQDMVEEILTRLPPKSLMRFKSVSKSFKSLISGTNFCKSHLKQALGHNNVRLMNLEGCDTNLVVEARTGRLVWADEEEGNHTSYLAQCNGLFCLGIGNDIFLKNLSTLQLRKVPTSQIELPMDYGDALVFFGLGYHEAAEDYKLVRIALFDGADFRNEVKVYSRNIGTWKRLQDFPYKYPVGRPGVYANGCLHWVVWRWNDDAAVGHYNVAVLDLTEYSYKLIQIPSSETNTRVIDIASVDEKLVAFQCPTDNTSNIWILNHESGAEPWTRITIQSYWLSTFDASIYFQPLFLSKSNEMLIRVGPKKVIRFDMVKKRCSDDHSPSLTLDCEVISYVESIVSPYAT